MLPCLVGVTAQLALHMAPWGSYGHSSPASCALFGKPVRSLIELVSRMGLYPVQLDTPQLREGAQSVPTLLGSPGLEDVTV